MRYQRVIFSFLIIVFSGISNMTAQELSGEEIEARFRNSVSILSDYVSLIYQKDKSDGVKKYYLDKALNLFVNKGEPFEADSIVKDGSYVLIKSTYRPKGVKRKIKDYLQGVKDMRYGPIDFSSVKFPSLPKQIERKDIEKIGDNLYKYTVLITREFAGYIEGQPVYKDITPYKYTFFLTEYDTVDGKEFSVLLNDIEVEVENNI